MDVFLETDRLVLRRFTAGDLELLVELDGDPAVKRYIDGGAMVVNTASWRTQWEHDRGRGRGEPS